MIGPSIRHGPHHGAQQSNRTTPELFRISCAKFWSVTTTGLAGLAGWAVALVSTLPHLSHVTIGIEQNLPLGCRSYLTTYWSQKFCESSLLLQDGLDR